MSVKISIGRSSVMPYCFSLLCHSKSTEETEQVKGITAHQIYTSIQMSNNKWWQIKWIGLFVGVVFSHGIWCS